jgi:hypothetical protein
MVHSDKVFNRTVNTNCLVSETHIVFFKKRLNCYEVDDNDDDGRKKDTSFKPFLNTWMLQLDRESAKQPKIIHF